MWVGSLSLSAADLGSASLPCSSSNGSKCCGFNNHSACKCGWNKWCSNNVTQVDLGKNRLQWYATCIHLTWQYEMTDVARYLSLSFFNCWLLVAKNWIRSGSNFVDNVSAKTARSCHMYNVDCNKVCWSSARFLSQSNWRHSHHRWYIKSSNLNSCNRSRNCSNPTCHNPIVTLLLLVVIVVVVPIMLLLLLPSVIGTALFKPLFVLLLFCCLTWWWWCELRAVSPAVRFTTPESGDQECVLSNGKKTCLHNNK